MKTRYQMDTHRDKKFTLSFMQLVIITIFISSLVTIYLTLQYKNSGKVLFDVVITNMEDTLSMEDNSATILVNDTNSTKLISANIVDGILNTAIQLMNVPYKYGAPRDSVTHVDCSSFVVKVLNDNGFHLGWSTSQFMSNTYHYTVAYEDRKPGDIIVYKFGKKGVSDHCSIVIDEDTIIHASSTMGKVGITNNYNSQYVVRVIRIRDSIDRIIGGSSSFTDLTVDQDVYDQSPLLVLNQVPDDQPEKRIRLFESKDNPKAKSPSGTYKGYYQFSDSLARAILVKHKYKASLWKGINTPKNIQRMIFRLRYKDLMKNKLVENAVSNYYIQHQAGPTGAKDYIAFIKNERDSLQPDRIVNIFNNVTINTQARYGKIVRGKEGNWCYAPRELNNHEQYELLREWTIRTTYFLTNGPSIL